MEEGRERERGEKRNLLKCERDEELQLFSSNLRLLFNRSFMKLNTI